MDTKIFDPNSPGVNNGCYFGLPFTPEEAQLVLISAPWDVTTSFGEGAAYGPDAILEASLQVDLYDVHNPEGWQKGIGTAEIDDTILARSVRLRSDARKVILNLEAGGSLEEDYVQRKLKRVNEGSTRLNEQIYAEAKKWLKAEKKVGLVGGDHSTPLGMIRAVAEHNPGLGILHIDAHADLREAYEGFTHSHASIMYNALKEVDGIDKLVQVGIRDFCEEEIELAANDKRIVQFDDYSLSAARFEGEPWQFRCQKIIAELPEQVYISFDIDGLTPEHCPNTGTPVPGGLTFAEAVYLIAELTRSGRHIVGFDLCEVAPSKDLKNLWDANVGARVLFKLCNFALL